MAEIQGETENAEELRLGPVFDKQTAEPLTNVEAIHILNQVHQVRKASDANYVPVPMVQRTQQYLERFRAVKSVQAAHEMKSVMQQADIRPFEACSIVNLMPGTAEEAKALVPSLENVGSRFPEEDDLQAVLDAIATFKEI